MLSDELGGGVGTVNVVTEIYEDASAAQTENSVLDDDVVNHKNNSDVHIVQKVEADRKF